MNTLNHLFSTSLFTTKIPIFAEKLLIIENKLGE